LPDGAMKTIDLYILRKTVWPLSAAIGIVLAAMLLERLVHLLDLVVNQGGPFFLLLKMLVNLVPTYLGLALPAAFFAGVLMAAMRLSGDSELDAIQASGVGLFRLLIPIMGLAVVLMIFSVVIIGFMQPYTRYAYRALVYVVTNTAWDAALERGAFFTGFGGKTILIDGIADGGRELTGIFIYEPLDEGGSATTTATKGTIFRSPNEFEHILHLSHGVRVEVGTEQRAKVLSFEEFDLPLEQAVGPAPFRDRGEQIRELTLVELFGQWLHPTGDFPVARVGAEFNGRLVRIASFLFLPALAFPLGIGSRRRRHGAELLIGAFLLVLYHHLLQFGETMAQSGKLSPAVALWGPFVVLSSFSAWGLYKACQRPGDHPLSSLLGALNDLPQRLRGSGRRALGGA
jgi:lipopolysaccharide export system permease protein